MGECAIEKMSERYLILSYYLNRIKRIKGGANYVDGLHSCVTLTGSSLNNYINVDLKFDLIREELSDLLEKIDLKKSLCHENVTMMMVFKQMQRFLFQIKFIVFLI